jgi:hypothetical protein
MTHSNKRAQPDTRHKCAAAINLSSAGRLVTVFNTGDKMVPGDIPADLGPVAGNDSAELPPHSWGAWAIP